MANVIFTNEGETNILFFTKIIYFGGNGVYFVWKENDIVFRGAPSGYFGESSAGTFNPSWYLNDLGTMYKRVSCLIFKECYHPIIFRNNMIFLFF